MEDPDHIPLRLRLALLESLTLGDDASTTNIKDLLPHFSSTLFARSSNAQSQLLESIEKYKPIQQFVNDYKDNQAYLYPSTSSLINIDNGSGEAEEGKRKSRAEGEEEERSSISLLSTQSTISLLLESEADLRQLDRDLRMCEHHYERGTAGAGKLADYEALAPRLSALQKQTATNKQQQVDVEKRVMQLVDTYSTQIDTMSKLFINWDQILTQTEDALTRLERSRT